MSEEALWTIARALGGAADEQDVVAALYHGVAVLNRIATANEKLLERLDWHADQTERIAIALERRDDDLDAWEYLSTPCQNNVREYRAEGYRMWRVEYDWHSGQLEFIMRRPRNTK